MSAPAAEARCSVLSAAVDEPLVGSAPRARAWLVVEQPGPYGFSALTESHLPAAVRDSLGSLPKTTGTTVLLARQVGRHADDHGEVRERRFWFAHTSPGGVRMRTGTLEDADLLRPDLADVLTAAARGELPPWGARSTAPVLLVCTNARRDICCATVGRPVAESLAADPAYAGDVLEVSHLGGHRFAPTALLLPSGHAFGRLDPASAREVLDAAREQRLGALDHYRGRTALAQPAQVAEHAVRLEAGVVAPRRARRAATRRRPGGAGAPAVGRGRRRARGPGAPRRRARVARRPAPRHAARAATRELRQGGGPGRRVASRDARADAPVALTRSPRVHRRSLGSSP